MKPANLATNAAHFVKVIIAPADPEAPPYETRQINYHNDRSRAWLEKVQWWALHNGYAVHIVSVIDIPDDEG